MRRGIICLTILCCGAGSEPPAALFGKAEITTHVGGFNFEPNQRVALTDKKAIAELLKWFPALGVKAPPDTGVSMWSPDITVKLFTANGTETKVYVSDHAWVEVDQGVDYQLEPGCFKYFKKMFAARKRP